MSRILDALESSDRRNSIIGRAMGRRLPYANEDLEIKAAIAAVLASLTATLTSVGIAVVVLL